ncbi:gag-pol polyprotein [Tanacetum coccineum]
MAVKFEIEKFNRNNFSLWKLKIKAILRKDKCLAAIGERPAEVTDDSKWDEMNGNAIANLHLALADGVLSSIKEKKSANCKIDSQERAEILLQSLPDSYDQVIINLTSNVLSDYLVFDDVAAAILEEKNRRNNREDRQTNSRQVEALVVTRGRSMKPGSSGSHNHGKSKAGKKNFKCFKCGKMGHFRKDCRGLNTSYPQGNVASTSEDGNALCCEAAVANESRKRFADVWLFDTGATFHMTARREWFHQYKPISGGGSVCSCNDHELKIIRIGSIMVKMHDGTVRTIQDVRHVKGLKKNLLSLGQLDDLGCKLGHMSEQGMKILVERKLLHGLTNVSLPFCEHCVISKQHRLKFNTLNSRSIYVLELVHSDVWQAPVLSWRSKIEILILERHQVFEEHGINGGEYTGGMKIDTFCRQEGIKMQYTKHTLYSSTEWRGRADEQTIMKESRQRLSRSNRIIPEAVFPGMEA